MHTFFKWFKNTADHIAAAMLAAMSIIFILQIVVRYIGGATGLSLNLGWTLELLLTLWLWLVFWASAFCISDKEHIRFDVLINATSRKIQRYIAAFTALIIASALAYSFLPTIDYILFYKIKKSAVMRIRMDYVFSIYGIFLVALIVRYTWRFVAHVSPFLYKKYYQGQSSEAPDEF